MVVAYEVYCPQSGHINLKVLKKKLKIYKQLILMLTKFMSVSKCLISQSACANYIENLNGSTIGSASSYNIHYPYCNKGYNYYNSSQFGNITAVKGYVPFASPGTGYLSVDTSTGSKYSDYTFLYKSGYSSYSNFQRVDLKNNFRFYLRIYYDYETVRDTINFSKQYIRPGNYKISSTINLDSGVSNTTSVLISQIFQPLIEAPITNFSIQANSFDSTTSIPIRLFVSIEYNINSSLSMFIDYGDGQTTILSVDSPVIQLSKLYNVPGLYLIKSNIIGYQFNGSLTVNITGGKFFNCFIFLKITFVYFIKIEKQCAAPFLTIEKQMTFNNPLQIERSKLFTVSSNETSQCEIQHYTLKKSWDLMKFDDLSQQFSIKIDLSTNPTSLLNELVVQSNTLSYGLYKFNFTIEIQALNLTKLNSIQTYIEIIPTGLVIFALPNGVSQILIGSSQSVSLKPSIYSYDYDQVINANSLIFGFYCKKTNTSSISTRSYPNQSLLIRNNQDCFGQNINGYSFDVSQSTQLNILAKSLIFMGNTISYDFKIETSYLNKNYSQEIRIDIDPSDNIPIVSLGYN